MFDTLSDEPSLQSYLSKVLLEEKAFGSWVFFGSHLPLVREVAEEFAARAVGVEPKTKIHADIHHFLVQGKIAFHTVDSIRLLQEQAYLEPLEAGAKALLVHHAERMLPTASNALLKIFEEPPSRTLILLLTSHPSDLLPTIKSRCRRVAFSTESAVAEERLLPARFSKLLSHFTKVSYQEKKALYKELEEVISKEQDKHLSEKKEALLADQYQEVPRLMREKLEKEIEGEVQLLSQKQLRRAFQEILFWFRDLSLLQASAGEGKLFYHEQKEDLLRIAQLNPPIPLEKISKKLTKAELMVLRGLPLSHVLESSLGELF